MLDPNLYVVETIKMYTYVNVGIELFSMLMLLPIAFYQLTNEYRGKRLNKIFSIYLIIHLFNSLLDMLTWIFDQAQGSQMVELMIAINYLVYISSGVGMIVFIIYIIESIPVPNATHRKIMIATCLIFGIYIILITISQFTGLVYRIDQRNWFYWGPAWWIPYLFSIIFSLMIILIVLHYRKKMSLRKTTTFIAYALIPAVAYALNVFEPNIVLHYASVSVSIVLIFVNVQMEQDKKLKEKELELYENKISLMLSQIKPHFLYNTLTAIDGLNEDNEDVHEAIINFSEYLRSNLESLSEKKLIPFKEELKHAQHYLQIEKMRFEEKLKIKYDLQVENFSVPVLTIEPLVENAVQHGITGLRSGGTIIISTRETEDDYIVAVSDNGKGFDMNDDQSDDHEIHFGIESIKARLANICNGQLIMKSEVGKGTTATIILPKNN